MKLIYFIGILAGLLFCTYAYSQDFPEKYVRKRVVLSRTQRCDYTGDTFWKCIRYGHLAFDDNGLIYALGVDHILIVDENGKRINEIPLSINSLNPWIDALEVSTTGNRQYIQTSEAYYIIENGRLINRIPYDYLSIDAAHDNLRRMDGTLVDALEKKVLDYNLNVIRSKGKSDRSSWLDTRGNADSYGNRFKHLGNVIQKYSPQGELIESLKLDVPLKEIPVHGIDGFVNIYLMEWDRFIYKISPKGKILYRFPIQYYGGELSSAVYSKSESYPDPFVRYWRITGDGAIYDAYTFRNFTRNAFEQWLKEGGEYAVIKYEPVTVEVMAEARKLIEDAVGVKKYSGSEREYREADLALPFEFYKDTSDYTVSLYVRALRNEIFARHGRTFESEDLKELFGASKWYKANPNYSDSMLNETERRNVSFIQDYEKKQGWQ